MRTLTDEEKIELENKETYEALKAELLKEYKGYATDLEFADDDFEEGLINDRRENLASKIKNLSNKLREIENLETYA